MDEELTVVERLERVLDNTDVHNDYADGVRHDVSEALKAITEAIEDDVRDCVHCGSPFTYHRSDGDIGCHDCPGIMPQQYRCDGCGHTGTRDNLADDECPWYNDGTHHLAPDVRICPWCGEQGTSHDLQRHDCPEGCDG